LYNIYGYEKWTSERQQDKRIEVEEIKVSTSVGGCTSCGHKIWVIEKYMEALNISEFKWNYCGFQTQIDRPFVNSDDTHIPKLLHGHIPAEGRNVGRPRKRRTEAAPALLYDAVLN
jgi:hypothetical protein